MTVSRRKFLTGLLAGAAAAGIVGLPVVEALAEPLTLATAKKPVFRDPSGWYHIVVENWRGEKTIYVNGHEATWFGAKDLPVEFNMENATCSVWVKYDGKESYYASELVAAEGVHPVSKFGYQNEDGVWVPRPLEEIV